MECLQLSCSAAVATRPRRRHIPASALSPSSSTTSLSALWRSGSLSSGAQWVHHQRKQDNGKRLRERGRRSGAVLALAQAGGASPLRVIISGAPASGKGTQCELIVEKFGLVHISAGDLLRAEVAQGTPNGLLAKSYMDAGKLVPDSVVNDMVKSKLLSPEAQEKGWLLDGYPRSQSQGDALVEAGIAPDAFVLLDVPDEVIVERVAGRRSDPETGKIYHLKFSPPPNDPQILGRLQQRSDDTEEKVKARLETHASNVGNVLGLYEGSITQIDGNRDKNAVFEDIAALLASIQEEKEKASQASGSGHRWRGMPTRLNDIPHTREIRRYFYVDVCAAAKSAVADGKKRLQVDLLIPELNPEMDVYRIGTLLELMRELAFTFAAQGRRVKVCVQGAMGQGIFRGMPLQLSGTRRMLELMDWGQEEEITSPSNAAGLAERISVGAIGAQEVTEEDEVFLLMAPQNAVGNCILEDMEAMTTAAGDRPVILVNPRLRDVPSAGGVMQVQGRAERLQYQETFSSCYVLRLLFQAGTQYPIVGALRLAHPAPYEVYKRADISFGKEEYVLCDTFPEAPASAEIAGALAGRKRSDKREEATGFWSFLSKVLG